MLQNSIIRNKPKNQIIADQKDRDIFDRLKAGEPIRLDDPEYPMIQKVVNRTIKLSAQLNTSTSIDRIRQRLSKIIGTPLDESTTVFVPFHTNFGRFTQIGKNVFINHACSFLDMGGISIEDEVLIGPKVNLITENHPLEPADRRAIICKPILIITYGVGYHQIKGQPRQTIRKGDVVKCQPNVVHWHGASQDTGLHQMYILPKTEKGIVTWLQKVTDEEYSTTYPIRINHEYRLSGIRGLVMQLFM